MLGYSNYDWHNRWGQIQHSYNHETGTPTVSVIMNCLNCSKYLREAIDRVYAQTFKDWEIIFWDNASTDSSAEIAKSYDTKLRYFRGDKTVPLYAARNFALKEAQGKYIAFLDCDDYWLPQKLERQVEIFESDKNIGLVYSNVEILERNGFRRKKFNKKQPSGRIFRYLLRKYNISLPTTIISKHVLESLRHWFDDSLNFSGDADLFLRIAHDWNVFYLPEVTAIYREHDESFTSTKISYIPIENEYILNKLSNIYEGFRKEYETEIKAFRKWAQIAVIMSYWKAGKNVEARKVAIENARLSNIFIILYLMSYLSFPLMNKIRVKVNSLLGIVRG